MDEAFLGDFVSLNVSLALTLVRTFVAIEIPKNLQKRINEFGKRLTNFVPLRLVASQNLHLTLFFLGEIPRLRIPEVAQAVKKGALGIKPFYLFLGKPEFFTHGLWLEVDGQIDALKKLYQQIGKELKARNFDFETRPFSAHITVGRTKKRIKSITSIKSTMGIMGRFEVSSVTIFTSELTPEGPVYQRQAKIDLI